MFRPYRVVAARARASQTLRATLFVAGGTAMAQVITAAATPVLTRLYGPETLGVLGSVLAYTGIIVPVAGLCLPLAVIVSENAQQRRNVARLALVAGAIVSVVAVVGSPLVLGETARHGVSWPALFATVAALIFFGTAAQLLHQGLLVGHRHRLLGRLLVVQSTLFVIAQLAVGLIHPSAQVLVVVSASYSLLILVPALLVPGLKRRLLTGHDHEPLLRVLRRWREFPLYRAPQVLLSGIGVHLPALLLTWYADLFWVGLFMVVHRVLALPVTLIGKSVGDVIYLRTVEALRKYLPVRHLLLSWTGACTGVAVLGAGLIFIGGPFLFAAVFGDEWAPAGNVAQAMSLWMVGALMSRPVVGSVPALGLSRHYLVSDLFAVAIRSCLLAWFLTTGAGVVPALYAWAVVSLCGNGYITGVGLLRAGRLDAASAKRGAHQRVDG